MVTINDLVSSIDEIMEEEELPHKVTDQLEQVKEILNKDENISIKKDKCFSAFQELEDSTEMEAGVRTQLWNIVCLLEQL